MNAEQNLQLMENQLRLVMIDRMLREKYNEIEYLVIQPPCDPNIVEINREDLNWLLSEHERCEELQVELSRQREVYEMQKEEQIVQYQGLENRYHDLEVRHQDVITSNAWRWGLRFAKVVHFFLTPIRVLIRK